MNSFRDSLGMQADALILRGRRTEILASNIANAATPNYKARDFDFASELERVSFRETDADTPDQTQSIGYRVPVEASLDGNTVELPVEQMQFSENALRYQTTLSLLNRRISGLMTAIKGE
ncbi:MAG: flagellar basal body rod protein FlgB [Rhodobacteraceae bacterium]|nr:flagellar basal body rod protein FlgB [Paracoccaceae bacterium]